VEIELTGALLARMLTLKARDPDHENMRQEVGSVEEPAGIRPCCNFGAQVAVDDGDQMTPSVRSQIIGSEVLIMVEQRTEDEETGRREAKAHRARILAVIALVLIGVGAGVVAWLTWREDPEPNTRELELLRVSLQVCGIGILGGLATLAYAELRREASFQDQLAGATREANHRRGEHDRDRRLERIDKAYRDAIDRKSRLDDQVLATMAALIAGYNDVKQIRRVLDARTRTTSGRTIVIADYDEHMIRLCARQLEFEQFKRTGPLLDQSVDLSTLAGEALGDDMSGGDLPESSFKDLFRRIEKYLNDIVHEYQQSRHLVAASPDGYRFQVQGGTEPSRLPNLHEFISTSKYFREGVSSNIDIAIRRLARFLATPPTLPELDEEEN
jgi:hypothetical protein